MSSTLLSPVNGVCSMQQVATLSFTGIFQQYYHPVVFFARRLLKDDCLAEDIVTDIFHKMWQKFADFSTESRAKAFLYISTRNACLNYLQQLQYQARVRNSIRYLQDEHSDYILNEITRAEVVRQIYSLVEKLPVECRKIILMSFSCGLSNQQIAQQLGISVHTVRNQKARGIDLVKRRLELWEKEQ